MENKFKYTSIRPGKLWLDTKGHRIQAHGGSIITVDDTFFWYGENKEMTLPGNGIWHWGVRCYSSKDLYNWEDEGLICPPQPENPDSPLNPSQIMDRPHIIFNEKNNKFVMWMKIQAKGDKKAKMAIAISDSITGEYELIKQFSPFDMSPGDFDLLKDDNSDKAYIYFERTHSDMICAELTDDYTDVKDFFSTHFPQPNPPFVREAPAVFKRNDILYMITSGTTGYFPNSSETAMARDYHGPWEVIGCPHINDIKRNSFCSQISSVFKHPKSDNLYIALADRWLVDLPEDLPDIEKLFEQIFHQDEKQRISGDVLLGLTQNNTSVAEYVWLPILFDGDTPYIKWYDEWKIEDFI